MKRIKKSKEQLRHEKFEKDINSALTPIIARHFKRKKSSFYMQGFTINISDGVMELELIIKEINYQS